MQLSHNDENNFSLSRFESMLKTNDVLFFDSAEFEDIINYYLENGKFALAKKAVKLGLAQHPTSTNLKLFKIEILVFEGKCAMKIHLEFQVILVRVVFLLFPQLMISLAIR